MGLQAVGVGTTVSLTSKRECYEEGTAVERVCGERPFAHSCSAEGPGPGLGRWEHSCGRPWPPRVCGPSKTMLGTAYRAFLPDGAMCWHQASVTVGTHANLPLPQLLHQLNVGALADESRTRPE